MSNISRNKGNTTIKFFRFIKNIKIECISGLTVWNITKFVLTVCPGRGLSNHIKTKGWPLAFTLYKDLLKNKKRSVTIFPASFSAWFLRKNIPHVIFYQLTKFHCPNAFTSRDVRQYMCCNFICLPVCDVMNFEITLAFWSDRFSIWAKNQDKNSNILRTKRDFNMK